ncbi:1,4-dihydroxy-2-naphthoate polyprenyltransferase [Paenibacillus oryzae]|uniref:1,4-dihydroxy-2-naphthoate polyprenyltransferase n=1 Tax=Paenibacillus oryzae TaxID=1844972 RepID=A0A1A5YQU8_9BACL|nr:1,4-dihydroxy-2-naphthoate polyprenyltransferase [Paenibacillus oryzae]OBR67991.1 1,4-dihydroxy-2-naphthoate polyprenyltransferase [Paenibacillus oryzae]
MNSIRKFLRLVEIQTKVASMLPFLLGSVYAWFRFQSFDISLWLLMFASLLLFDMTTTAINNLYDYVKAQKKQGYGYEEHNAIVKYGMNPIAVFILIVVMFLTSVAAGLLLVAQTGLVVLALGALSFGVGILYSFGPLPISRMPLGELFSGLFMGFVITFVAAYIHTDGNQLAAITLEGGMLGVSVNLLETFLLLLVSMPAVLGIAGIMLANNICDMEDDLANKRYTLPVYIGQEKALLLFHIIYYAALLDVPILLIMGVHPLIALPLLLTLIPVRRNIKTFSKAPAKATTFVLAVKNFSLTTAARIAVMLLAIFIPWHY